MTLLTAMEIAGNYPENIEINAVSESNNKFSAFCYMKKDGHIHKLMLSTQPVFDSESEATSYLHEIAVLCKSKYNS